MAKRRRAAASNKKRPEWLKGVSKAELARADEALRRFHARLAERDADVRAWPQRPSAARETSEPPYQERRGRKSRITPDEVRAIEGSDAEVARRLSRPDRPVSIDQVQRARAKAGIPARPSRSAK